MAKRERLTKIISNIEGMKIGLGAWILTFISITSLRLLMESFSGNQKTLFSFTAMFLHGPLFWIALLLFLVLIIHLFTKKKLQSIFNIALYGWVIILVAPIIDFIFTLGSGEQVVTYIFDTPQGLLLRFFTFFGDNVFVGATLGIRVMTAIALLGIIYYVWKSTKSFGKTIGATLLSYIGLFLMGTIPSWMAALRIFPEKINVDIIRATYLSGDKIWGHNYVLVKDFFDREMASMWIILTFILLLFIFKLWKPEAWRSWKKSLRPLRIYLLLLAMFGGIYFGLIRSGTFIDFSFNGLVWLLLLLIAVFGAWVFAISINDLADIKIDKISNPDRPLAKKLLSESELKMISLSAVLISMAAAFTVDYASWAIIIVFMVINIIYSLPPFRLRRFIFFSSFLPALGVLMILFLGFNLTIAGNDLRLVPYTIIFLVLTSLTLAIPIKDLKDTEGDKKQKIQSLTTIYGAKRGLQFTAALAFISFLLFPLFLTDNSLWIPALIFGGLAVFGLNRKTKKELSAFVVYGVFILYIIFVHFDILNAPILNPV